MIIIKKISVVKRKRGICKKSEKANDGGITIIFTVYNMKERKGMMDEETRQDVIGMKKSMESMRAQMKMQNKEYQGMARAVLKAFSLSNGQIQIADESAAREAFVIADRYFGDWRFVKKVRIHIRTFFCCS